MRHGIVQQSTRQFVWGNDFISMLARHSLWNDRPSSPVVTQAFVPLAYVHERRFRPSVQTIQFSIHLLQ